MALTGVSDSGIGFLLRGGLETKSGYFCPYNAPLRLPLISDRENTARPSAVAVWGTPAGVGSRLYMRTDVLCKCVLLTALQSETLPTTPTD